MDKKDVKVRISEESITGNMFYEAVVDGTLYNYKTDGVMSEHISKEQWINVVLTGVRAK
tara:strand:+ start:333 stop:509 length:177 start_codon:yes stop_codon:yes gene_type:complete